MKQLVKAWRKSVEKVDGFVRYDSLPERKANLILLAIVVLFAIFRMATIHIPDIDRTVWKEIDHIMISENYYRHGYHFLKPEISWPAEEPRVTAMEFPLVPFLASLLYPVFGINAFSVRLVSAIAFLLLMVYVYKLARREAGVVLALSSAFFAGLFPLFDPFRNILFSEPAMIFFSVFSIYHYAQWMDFRRKQDLALSILGFSLTLALKPTALYLLLPLAWICFRKCRFNFKKYGALAWPLAAALILPGLWYGYAYYLAQHCIDVFGVFGGRFGGHDKMQTFTMLSSMDWYYTMLWRLRVLLLGGPGLFFLLAGLAVSLFSLKRGQLFVAYLLAIACYFIIVAEGQADTSYRQLTIIPAASFFIGLGLSTFGFFIYFLALDSGRRLFKAAALPFSLLTCLALLIFFPLRKKHIFESCYKNAPVHTANWILAQEIKKVSPDSLKIIMAGDYTIHKGGVDVSPVTYYYSGRQGWTILAGQWNEAVVDNLKKKGAGLLGAIGYSREPELAQFLAELCEQYEILYQDRSKELLLLSLQNRKEVSTLPPKGLIIKAGSDFKELRIPFAVSVGNDLRVFMETVGSFQAVNLFRAEAVGAVQLSGQPPLPGLQAGGKQINLHVPAPGGEPVFGGGAYNDDLPAFRAVFFQLAQRFRPDQAGNPIPPEAPAGLLKFDKRLPAKKMGEKKFLGPPVGNPAGFVAQQHRQETGHAQEEADITPAEARERQHGIGSGQGAVEVEYDELPSHFFGGIAQSFIRKILKSTKNSFQY